MFITYTNPTNRWHTAQAERLIKNGWTPSPLYNKIVSQLKNDLSGYEPVMWLAFLSYNRAEFEQDVDLWRDPELPVEIKQVLEIDLTTALNTAYALDLKAPKYYQENDFCEYGQEY